MTQYVNQGGPLPADNVRFVVVHYTGGDSAASAVSWFQSPRSKVSAHVVIGRDGKCLFPVSYGRVAWHAGRSQWKDYTGLNRWSIGIELVNYGPLIQQGSKFVPAGVVTKKSVPLSDVHIGYHKNGISPYRHWQRYTPEQLKSLHTVLKDIKSMFPSVEDVLGHDDIAPNRKLDPGPAFDEFMPGLKALVADTAS